MKEEAATISVLVPYPVGKTYTYKVPEGPVPEAGDYVSVPLGRREVPGVVWDDAPEEVPAAKLKQILTRFDLPPMPEVHRNFIDWVSRYTMNDRGSVLKMALSAPGALENPRAVTVYKLSSGFRSGTAPPCKQEEYQEGGVASDVKLTPQRRRIIEVLTDDRPRRASEIAELAGCSSSVVKSMAGAGLLKAVELHPAPPCRWPDVTKKPVEMTEAQQKAASRLAEMINSGFSACLLDGVTGAGKTEVYFEAVAKAIESGRQALILLPEIALSNAFLERFEKRFGCAPGLWHSRLSPGKRKTTWRGVADGSCRVVVGARSALFLPYADLGVIVIDEEHDAAYKQDDGAIYHARDMGIVRASIGRIPVVLVSATPSLETMHNVWNARYERLHLPDRYGGARFPDVHITDMRKDKPDSGHFISPVLEKAVSDTLDKGEQTLLFLNRRGYAPLTLCRTCGHRIDCPRCTAWLVEHRLRGRLLCHHCGYEMREPDTCPVCKDTNSLTACGPGVERIFEEATALWPQARLLLMASDTADNEEKLRQMLDMIKERQVDIIIGTQIIAKGHHFPGLTCVGVIDADLGLQGGDLRATERTYQMLHQVAGRAGRAEAKGHVYLQTFNPESRIVQALASGKRDLFLQVEMEEREAANMPPFSRLAGIIISGRDEKKVDDIAKELGRTAPGGKGIRTYGPAHAPIARLRGRHRRRLLVVAGKNLELQKPLARWAGDIKLPSDVKITIDIDPQSFL